MVLNVKCLTKMASHLYNWLKSPIKPTLARSAVANLSQLLRVVSKIDSKPFWSSCTRKRAETGMKIKLKSRLRRKKPLLQPKEPQVPNDQTITIREGMDEIRETFKTGKGTLID